MRKDIFSQSTQTFYLTVFAAAAAWLLCASVRAWAHWELRFDYFDDGNLPLVTAWWCLVVLIPQAPSLSPTISPSTRTRALSLTTSPLRIFHRSHLHLIRPLVAICGAWWCHALPTLHQHLFYLVPEGSRAASPHFSPALHLHRPTCSGGAWPFLAFASHGHWLSFHFVTLDTLHHREHRRQQQFITPGITVVG